MIAVLQRVSESSVSVNENRVAKIKRGFLILIGIVGDDTEEDILWIGNKILNMRIFGDKEGKMNLSIKDIGGEILIVSQFTLHASTKKGNRPSFISAAKPDISIPLYNDFVSYFKKESGLKIETGIFGADMAVHLINDGPVTIIMDSKNRI